jgi:hypothetical protein
MRLVSHGRIDRFESSTPNSQGGGASLFIPANAKNIHRVIHSLSVIFSQRSRLYFHSVREIAGAPE